MMVAIWYLLRVLSEPAASLFFFVVDGNKKRQVLCIALESKQQDPNQKQCPRPQHLAGDVVLSLIWRPWQMLCSPIPNPHRQAALQLRKEYVFACQTADISFCSRKTSSRFHKITEVKITEVKPQR